MRLVTASKMYFFDSSRFSNDIFVVFLVNVATCPADYETSLLLLSHGDEDPVNCGNIRRSIRRFALEVFSRVGLEDLMPLGEQRSIGMHCELGIGQMKE